MVFAGLNLWEGERGTQAVEMNLPVCGDSRWSMGNGCVKTYEVVPHFNKGDMSRFSIP